MTATAEISILAFFIAAIISILVLIFRFIKKSGDEYVPFGPFLAISAIVVMFAGDGFVLHYFLVFCNMISSKILGIMN